MIRVVIAEDQAMVLGALAALLEIEPGLEVVGRAASADRALTLVREQSPEVLVTDIEMPGMSGLELAATVAARHPRTRVIILTTFARPGYLRRALEAGAAGYLWSAADPLTDRERQVLRLAAEGLTSSDIAASLQLSEGTIRNYLSDVISKLGAKNRVEAANLARARGWL